jgi:hypothetical protein
MARAARVVAEGVPQYINALGDCHAKCEAAAGTVTRRDSPLRPAKRPAGPSLDLREEFLAATGRSAGNRVPQTRNGILSGAGAQPWKPVTVETGDFGNRLETGDSQPDVVI